MGRRILRGVCSSFRSCSAAAAASRYASNSFALVSTKVVKLAERTPGGLTVAGAWQRARANPPDDPMGAPQGVDLVVVTGTAPSP